MSRESINMLIDANNIKQEKCELFKEYIHSLIILILDTYMGDEITDVQAQQKHFEWCWNKNNQNFKLEGLHFGDDKTKKYFLEFFFDVYYPLTKKDDNIQTNMLKLWTYIFDLYNTKTKSDMDTLLMVYRMLNNSLILS